MNGAGGLPGGNSTGTSPEGHGALVPRILQLRSEKSVIESRKAELRELDSYVASVRQRILSLADLFSGAGVELPEEPDPSSIRSLAVALRLAGERKGEIADLERDLAALSASLAELRENLEGNGGKTAEPLHLRCRRTMSGNRTCRPLPKEKAP